MSQRDTGSSESHVGRQVGSYRILEAVGRGGMGEVYRGWDDKLGRPVAVKVLPPALATDSMARKRFVRETRVACRVVHPYVATVFDVVEHETSLFLVMEYLEGKRLDEVLHEERTGPRDVTRYGLEIAEALAAIHGAGLVHRDLKPANVMVTPAGHVKVMDFGVAFPLRPPALLPSGSPEVTEPRLTGEGLGVGTISYMSPEQVRGQPVDPRSDLFSLGIVLYEAITGEHPFMRESVLATASAILNEPPGTGPEPRSLTDSGPLRQVVLRLLEKDPDRRYQTSEDVVADLRAVVAGEGLVPRPGTSTTKRTRRAAVAVGAALLLAVVAYSMWEQIRTKRPPARPVVAVLPFEDRTGEAFHEDRGRMLAELLSADLSESRKLRALGAERVEQIEAGLPADALVATIAAAVSRHAAVSWIVGGTVYKDGATYQAAVDVFVPGAAEPREKFRVQAAGMGALVDLASIGLKRRLFPDDPAAAAEQPVASRIGSVSDEAKMLLARARRARREYRLTDAMDDLNRAIQLDPQYLAARIQLAETLDAAGYGKLARESADAAVRLVEPPAKPPTERLALEARAAQARTYDRIEDEIRLRSALAERFPDEPDVLLALGMVLWRHARYDDALPRFDTARDLDRGDPRPHIGRARVLASPTRLDRDAALASLGDAERLLKAMGSQPGLALVQEERGNIALEWKQYEAARDAYRAAAEGFGKAGMPVAEARARGREGIADLFLGRLAEAQERFAGSLAQVRAAGNYRVVVDDLNRLGATQYWKGDLADAERTLRQALEEAKPLDNPELDVDPLNTLASLLNHTGRPGEAKAFAQSALDRARSRNDAGRQVTALTLLADIAQQAGALTEAVQDYRDAIALADSLSRKPTSFPNTLGYFSEALAAVGRLGEALDAADRAVAAADEAQQPMYQIYQRLYRADWRSELGMWPEAEADLARAQELVKAGDDAFREVPPQIAVERGLLELRRGNQAAAATQFEAVVRQKEFESVYGLRVTALLGLAEIAIARGDPKRAADLAGQALQHDGATAVERCRSRVVLARALLASGDAARGPEEARRARDEASGMGLPLPEAAAGALLVGRGEDGPTADRDERRLRARKAWGRWMDGVPEARRAGVRARADLRWLVQILEAPTSQSRDGAAAKSAK